MDPECHALLCGQGKAVGQAGIIGPQAKQAGDQGFIRAMSLSGGGKLPYRPISACAGISPKSFWAV